MKRLVAGTMSLLLTGPIAVAAVFTGPGGATSAPSERATAEIPPELLPIYMAAALTCPGLPWPVLAGIGWVESRHGGGRADPISGDIAPPIVGPAIDGREGSAAIRDASQPDGWAHALGPMQFLSTTWSTSGLLAPDRPPGSTPNVHNAWDAIYSAASYLCAGRTEFGDVRAAVLRYNRSDTYYREVIAKATDYESGSVANVVGSTVTGSPSTVIAAAMTQLGVRYRWGAMTPGVGFDCSGLVQWAFAQAGVNLPRTTSQQVLSGVAVQTLGDLRPGDLIFSPSIRAHQMVEGGHVAIYAGGGQVIVAPRTGDFIDLRPVPTQVQAIRRVLNQTNTEHTARTSDA